MDCPVELSLPGFGGAFFTAAGFAGAAVGFVGVTAGFAGAAVGFAGAAVGFAVVAGFVGVAGVATLGSVGVTSDGGVVGVDVASYNLTMLQMMKPITTRPTAEGRMCAISGAESCGTYPERRLKCL